MEEYSKNSITKRLQKEQRLKQFVQSQKEETSKESTKGLTGTKVGVLQEACVFITDFSDGPNDEVAKICNGTSKNLSKEQSFKKLHDFLKGVEKEYDDC